MAERSQQFDRINIDPTPRTIGRRLSNIYHAAPADIHEAGMNWYGNVHDAARKAASEAGKSTRQAAGVAAAVSPNMNWETNNIDAFHDIDRLTPEHWAMIHASAAQGSRSPEVKSMITEVAPSIAPATDKAIVKAHRIWHGGEDPEAVLDRTKAPKTNTFFRNINEPHVNHGATVDGRHADLVVDAMRPWTMKRGIGSAGLKRGGRSRYERYSDATSAAAHREGILPHQLQAVDWEMGKMLERNFDPTRKQGDARTGQSYQRRLRDLT